VVALNIVVGDLVYLDADDRVIAIENWKTALQRYLGFCREHGIEPEDLTAFDG
jgi:2,4'-dihydroxyacetophenone dioxygenase